MTDINVGQLSEAINGKMDRDASNIASPKLPIFLVDVQYPTAENNYTWYRKYSDGWVEQGGTIAASSSGALNIVVNLMVTMANSAYQVYTGAHTGTSTSDGYAFWLNTIGNKTTSTITLRLDNTNYIQYAYWEVKGMAAV